MLLFLRKPGGSPRFGLLIALGAGMLVAGCAWWRGAPPPTEEAKDTLTVRVEVGQGLNPNVAGQPAPVFLRIYQLSDKTAFESATYADLSSSDKTVLEGSLLARRDIEVCPREYQVTAGSGSAPGCAGDAVFEVTLDYAREAKYLAVMAEFYNLRDPDGNWRAVTALDPIGESDSPALVIRLERSRVDVGFE